VARIDTATRRAGEPVEIGGSLTGIAVSATRVWVSDNERNELVGIDPRDTQELDHVDVKDGAVRVAVADDGLWVTGQEDVATRVTTPRNEIDASVHVGNGPIGLAFDGELVWVANSEDDTVSAIDADQGEFVDSVPVGRAPVAIAATRDEIWVANQDAGTLSRVDLGSRTVAEEAIDLGTRPRGVAASGRTVWVVGTNSNRLVRVDF
jgi:YVTN family beta-propeller protein